MRASEWKPYREGLVLRSQAGTGSSYVDIGLDRMAFVPQELQPNTRVTLQLGEQPTVQFMPEFGENMIVGKVRVRDNRVGCSSGSRAPDLFDACLCVCVSNVSGCEQRLFSSHSCEWCWCRTQP
jgi:hypothetical protein